MAKPSLLHWSPCLLFLLFPARSAAQAVQTENKPLDQVQVLGLITGEVPNDRVATLVLNRGISFEPKDHYIQIVQKAGGNATVLEAVRSAKRSSPSPRKSTAGKTAASLDRLEVFDLLDGGVPNEEIARLVKERGIDFDPAEEYLLAYQIVGAQEVLLRALRASQKAKTSPTRDIPQPKETGLPNSSEKVPTGSTRRRISGEVAEAKLVFHPNPVYPPLAKMARVQGKVILEAIIGTDGKIEELNVISGHPLLIKATMDAVSRWRYLPTLWKGAPVKVITTVEVNFTLSG